MLLYALKAHGFIFDTASTMMILPQNKIRIFTWHVHGSYLYYLSQGPFEIFIPVNAARSEGYYGRGNTFPFGTNVHEVPVDELKDLCFDVLLFQSFKNYQKDQFEVLTVKQRNAPKIYLEHNTPHGTAVTTRHYVNDADILLVHVTHFNRLMWDNGQTPTTVIPHGVTDGKVPYSGNYEKGFVAINHLPHRGRVLGWDIFRKVNRTIPLDLAGMGNEGHGIGEVLHPRLPEVRAQYRFFFHPVRHTSLALAVCEAMMAGVPVVGLATTELVTAINNGVNGWMHTNIDVLIDNMKGLLKDRIKAKKMGRAGQETAMELWNIQQFSKRWQHAFEQVLASQKQPLNLVQ
ncbi:glycosyltransferase family 4 protein [Niabella yanshanensis]|uniref:Glycosyltransferase family 4 protein n=1 Tax=Niabella yanshanensis TaxID=577386 RepID=A0ABZ0WDM7_9BACT|nr:glycosyltransferase family 4 protein [Niabella yanshanensis]WQD40793.1 glycosyltransferase family 4 protein [Niabella yanshanensis]